LHWSPQQSAAARRPQSRPATATSKSGKWPNSYSADIGHHLGVSDSSWARFVARELTPRFPDGLTVSDTQGQWRDRDNGSIVREPSKRVEIVLPVNADDDAKLDAAVAAYKRAFHQQSVGVIVRSACVSF
jgi:hypothetical protein